MTTQNTFTHAKMRRTLDNGGYSGALTVTAAGNEHDGGDTLVFVESELLGYLVLTPAEAAELGTPLARAAAS